MIVMCVRCKLNPPWSKLAGLCAECVKQSKIDTRRRQNKAAIKAVQEVLNPVLAVPPRKRVLSAKQIAAMDREQEAIDKRCREIERKRFGIGPSPCRVLSKEEIAAIAHTITPISKIPYDRPSIWID